ncbi:MAG: S-layer homology domain-containing protein, partial [Sedimentibacter sp.]
AMGYAKGSDGLFRPDDKISRAEFVSLLIRVLGISNQDAVLKFTDVKPGDWFAKDVALAAEKGYVKGYEDGSFKPNSPITRQEIGTIIGSLLEDDVTNADEILSLFSDDIPQWAKLPVAKAVKAEIIKGLPGNIFGGVQNTTRAEATVMLLRYIDK